MSEKTLEQREIELARRVVDLEAELSGARTRCEKDRRELKGLQAELDNLRRAFLDDDRGGRDQETVGRLAAVVIESIRACSEANLYISSEDHRAVVIDGAVDMRGVAQLVLNQLAIGVTKPKAGEPPSSPGRNALEFL